MPVNKKQVTQMVKTPEKNITPQNTGTDEKTLEILTHVLGIISGFIGPLIILLASENENVKNHSRRALNWQFSLLIYYGIVFIFFIISLILIVILIGFIFIWIIWTLFIALGICNLVFCILAAVRASNNEIYSYPLAIRFFQEKQ